MRVWFSALLLGLAWFAALNLITSMAAWGASRGLLKRTVLLPASLLLALRLLPSVGALAFVGLVFLPAHVRFEPADIDERFGVTIFALAALGAALLGRSAWRLWQIAAIARARSVLFEHMTPLPSGEYEMAGFPGISLAGVFRPRILVGADARQALSAEELDVAIAHERAHWRSLDNLKRCAIFCAPDFFGASSTAAALEAQWRARAEHDADARAVRGDEQRALHLASALLKVARSCRSPHPPLSPVWSTFNEPKLLEDRVRALVGRTPAASRGRARLVHAILPAAAALGATAWLAHAPYEVHNLTEVVVSVLP